MNASKIIFYLDDDSDDLYFFKNAAGSLGHQVVTFYKAETMLKKLRTQHKLPEIIFIDVHMPILNGEEILTHLKTASNFKHIPVVMISGAYPKKLVRQLLTFGADYLMKKTASTDLKPALENVLNIVCQKEKLSA